MARPLTPWRRRRLHPYSLKGLRNSMVTPARAASGGTRLARAWTPGNLSRPRRRHSERGIHGPGRGLAPSPRSWGKGLSVIALKQGNWPSGSARISRIRDERGFSCEGLRKTMAQSAGTGVHARGHVVVASADSEAFRSLRRRSTSRLDRYRMGKQLRRQVPRSSLGDWSVQADRPDPVQLIIESHRGRLDWLIPLRVGRMTATCSLSAELRGVRPAVESSGAADRRCSGP